MSLFNSGVNMENWNILNKYREIKSLIDEAVNAYGNLQTRKRGGLSSQPDVDQAREVYKGKVANFMMAIGNIKEEDLLDVD